MFLLQRVSSVVDSISNTALHSLLAYPDLHHYMDSLPLTVASSSLPSITAIHHCLAMCVDKGVVIVLLSSSSSVIATFCVLCM